MPVSDQGQLTALPLTILKKKGHDTVVKGQGKAITPYQNSVIKYHQFRSVVVDSSPAVADLLQSAFEVFEFKQRENFEKLKSLVVDCIMLCGKQTSFCEVTAMKRWTKQQFLASAVQVMVLELCCVTRKQDIQGISLIFSSFDHRLMMLLY